MHSLLNPLVGEGEQEVSSAQSQPGSDAGFVPALPAEASGDCDPDDDGQPDEAREWADYDGDC